MMVGEISADSGEIWWGDRVVHAYLSQTMSELDPENTVFDELMRLGRNVDVQLGRNILGRFLFSGDDIEKRVGDISGGEKSKLMFAILLTRRPNCLLLDEPTNHLDLPSREVLEEALEEYEGTLIFVSHDRAFIDRLATHTLELGDGRARMYHGTYSDVLYRKQEERREAEEAEKLRRREELEEARKGKKSPKRRKKTDTAGADARPDQIMDEIELLEAQIAALEDELNRPEVYLDYEKAAEVNKAISEKKSAREELFRKLETSLGE
jgi:ATP-binding cassette subfamily F protein 3